MPWIKRYDFFVPGDPKGQPRMAPVIVDGEACLRDPGTAREWRARAERAARQVRGDPFPQGKPVGINIKYLMPNPHGHWGWHTIKPDNDNLEKSTWDAFTGAHIWKDDCQVASNRTQKIWTPEGQEPGAAVGIYVWEETQG